MDGTVAMDFLQAGGWTVERLAGDPGPAGGGDPRQAVSELARGGAVELAVAVTAGPEDALRLAPFCTELHRLADPPVILVCDFSGRIRQHAASSALGADAVAHDPEELLRCAAERLPGEGQRRWGVGLSRTPGVLVLTPTGRLDAVSVGRLADVALSRHGTFSELVLDLRDLAEITPAGAGALAAWAEGVAFAGLELRLVADDDVRAALGESDLVARWANVAPAAG